MKPSEIILHLATYILSGCTAVFLYLASLWHSGVFEYFINQVVVQGPKGKGSLAGSVLRPWAGLFTTPKFLLAASMALYLIYYLHKAAASPDRTACRIGRFMGLLCASVLVTILFFLDTPLPELLRFWHFFAIYVGFLGCAYLSTAGFFTGLFQKGKFDETQTLACFGAFSLAYSHAISWPAFESMLIPSFPLFVCLASGALSSLDKKLYGRGVFLNLRRNIILFASLVLIASITLKVRIPWDWGWSEPAIYEKRGQIDSPMFQAVKMSGKSHELISHFRTIIQENTGPEDSILVFSKMPVLYWIAQRKPATLALSHWFDICPDPVATDDAKRILNNPPKVIVWTEMDEATLKFYENQFRNGRSSGQRDLIAAFEELKPRYSLAYPEEDSGNQEIKIYIRKDLKP